MSSISLVFQVAFASQPGDASYIWTTVGGTQEVTYSRGQPNEYGEMETGESTITLSDPGSDMDPNNADGAHYPDVKRGKPIQAYISITDGLTVNYPLFQQFIERLPRAQAMTNWTQRTIQGVDAFGMFALAGLKGVSYPSELSSDRWGRVLDTIGWDPFRRNIDTGNSTLDAFSNDADSEVKALQHLLDVVKSENGLGFMNAVGDPRFIRRHSFITNTDIHATFADGVSIATGSYPDAIPYQSLAPESTDIVNSYSGHRSAEGSTVLTASDTASIDDYGPRTSDITSLVSTDNEVQDQLNWLLSQTKDPHERIDSITVMPGEDLTRWATLLGLEVGDRILVVEQPSGYSAPVETEFIIRHLSVNLPLPLTAGSFTFQLTPITQDNWLVLDDPSRGALDANKLAY